MYVLFGVLTSVASSTGIVLLNKLLFAHDDFTFPATLTGWHLLITHGVLSAAIRLNVFQSKRLARKYVVWFCVFDAAAMALQNLSLTYNTINFYQTCKLFTIPVTVIIERFAGQAFPKASKMVSLALITCGVALCTGANFNTNTIGVCVGLGATVGSALVIVSTSWLQKSQGLSSSQLLHRRSLVPDSCTLTARKLCAREREWIIFSTSPFAKSTRVVQVQISPSPVAFCQPAPKFRSEIFYPVGLGFRV